MLASVSSYALKLIAVALAVSAIAACEKAATTTATATGTGGATSTSASSSATGAGAGGASSTSTSSHAATTTSTSTGTMGTACEDACAKLVGCGLDLCSQQHIDCAMPSAGEECFATCILNASCDELKALSAGMPDAKLGACIQACGPSTTSSTGTAMMGG